MKRSLPGRRLLTLALIALVVGSAGCMTTPAPATPGVATNTLTPTTLVATTSTSAAVTATMAAATPIETAATATLPAATATSTPRPSATSTLRPRPSATSSRTPTAPSAGGLVIATPSPGDRMSTVRVDRLPPEAQETMRLIARNGPFPYRQDGVVFENRERLLPAKSSGYYHEYTVKTPGSPDRGARRLVRGGQNELYYTDDHYDSFRRVTP